jgi:hypothetical protein
METLNPTERLRIRKQVAEKSVKLAVAGRWDEAVILNRELIDQVGGDVETFNRLGKALSEVGAIGEARGAYQDALRAQPGNPIATRNLGKLAGLKDTAAAAPQAKVQSAAFIEESGTSGKVMLQAVDGSQLRALHSNDSVELEVKGNAVNVLARGVYVGMLAPKVGMRLSRLMEGGNQYAATIVSATEPVQVMVTQTLLHPSQKGKVSFPQGAESTGVRAYVRKGLMKDEVKLDFGVDDEEDDQPDDNDDNPEAAGYTTVEHEDDSSPAVAIDGDDDEDDFDED